MPAHPADPKALRDDHAAEGHEKVVGQLDEERPSFGRVLDGAQRAEEPPRVVGQLAGARSPNDVGHGQGDGRAGCGGPGPTGDQDEVRGGQGAHPRGRLDQPIEGGPGGRDPQPGALAVGLRPRGERQLAQPVAHPVPVDGDRRPGQDPVHRLVVGIVRHKCGGRHVGRRDLQPGRSGDGPDRAREADLHELHPALQDRRQVGQRDDRGAAGGATLRRRLDPLEETPERLTLRLTGLGPGSQDRAGATVLERGRVEGDRPEQDDRRDDRTTGQPDHDGQELGQGRGLLAARRLARLDRDRVHVALEGQPGQPDRAIGIEARPTRPPAGQTGDPFDRRPGAHGGREDRQDGCRTRTGDESRERSRAPPGRASAPKSVPTPPTLPVERSRSRRWPRRSSSATPAGRATEARSRRRPSTGATSAAEAVALPRSRAKAAPGSVVTVPC